jgi:histidinol-phosphate/aromatic aminotransferase/cobyric acid decarboxylase-like protein
LGIHADDVLDASVNVNPYGPSPRLVAAVQAARLDRYPDPTAHRARQAVATALGVRAECVVLGNGAVDLLWTLVRALLPPGRSMVIAEPAFSEVAAAVAAVSARVEACARRLEDGFRVDLDALAGAARRTDARLAYLCAPCNPTGAAVDVSAVADLARENPSLLVVLDESFLALSERFGDERHPLPGNVLRVRSMTKEHALAGVRVGYLVAREDLAARIEAARPPWTINAFAQAAAVAAMHERAFVDDSRDRLLADRRRLCARLRDLGFSPLPSSTIFFLVRVRDGAAVRTRFLATHRVLVRDCASFGLPDFVRICAQPPEREARLLAAFREEDPP